jgi:7-carboxy-7-deazaguanine synthase
MIRINEIFHSIQTEGRQAGMACLFVRFQGCDVGCSWCDTKQTWNYEPETVVSFEEVKAQTVLAAFESEQVCSVEPQEIVDYCKDSGIDSVVITGGEPCSQEGLRELTIMLNNAGIFTCLETSGTYEVSVHPKTHVVVSPKIDMAGGRRIVKQAMIRADTIKLVIDRQRDLDAFLLMMDTLDLTVDFKKIYFQPCSMKPRSTRLCVDLAKKYNCFVSIQSHKSLGLR